MKKCFFLSILFSVFSLAACQAATTAQSTKTSQVELKACQLSAPGFTRHVSAQCGKLEVYEDRLSGSGRKISLHLAVIPAVSRSPEPDPLFFLAGGPGEAATQSFMVIYSALSRINQKRDIILVDQRGTGGSHFLGCPEGNQEDVEVETDAVEIRQYLQQCLAELDADPRLYTTSIAMDDLDEVRQALGYDQINLYGASYGTRAALVYARQHGDHLRTMILDGVVPLDWTLGPAVAGDAQRALNLLFKRCTGDATCQAAFPNLEQDFETVLQRLREKPISITLIHPSRGDEINYTLKLETFINTIHIFSYTQETAALLPLLIHQAAVQEDYRPLAAQSLITTESLASLMSPGMRFSVLCSEDVPFMTDSPTSTGYFGDWFLVSLKQICETWPSGAIPADFKQPVQSNTPTLLISGEADPVTPPQNGEQAARTLPNSLHIVVPSQGHINIFRGCIPKIAATFVESASVSNLDTACVQEIEPMPLFINFNGPQP